MDVSGFWRELVLHAGLGALLSRPSNASECSRRTLHYKRGCFSFSLFKVRQRHIAGRWKMLWGRCGGHRLVANLHKVGLLLLFLQQCTWQVEFDERREMVQCWYDILRRRPVQGPTAARIYRVEHTFQSKSFSETTLNPIPPSASS